MEDELFNACQPLLSSPPSKPALLPQLLAAISGGLIATVALPSSLIPQLVEEGMAKDLATAYLYSAVPACLFGGLLSAWVGRRKMVLLALGYIALPLSPSFAWLVPARRCSPPSVPGSPTPPPMSSSPSLSTPRCEAASSLSPLSSCSSFQSHRNGWPCRGGGKRHLQACPGLEVQSS